jgi:hypothetical protein
MANIFEDAWNAGKEWASDTADDVKDWATDKVIDYKIDQIKKDFKKIPSDIAAGFVTHDKLTPELIKQGWKEGLDGQPYNANLKYTADDWARDQANAADDVRRQAAATGGATSDAGTTGSSPFKLSQDLRQRTPSGTIYNPDISEYLNSGLFNYTGPGGVPEYTYGQGLPTDGAGYDIWGTPVGPNLYYEGQYGEGYVEPTGPADSAITLPPVTMPDGVPQIPPSNNPNTTTNNNTNNNGNGNGDKDLNYFETLAAMGIDPSDAPSTTFPGINDKVVQEGIINKNAVKETLPSGIIGGEEQVFDGKYNMLPSDDGAYDYTGLKLNPANQLIANDEQVYPSIYDMQASDDGAYDYTGLNRNIANDEQVYPSLYDMQASDDGDFNYDGVPLNPNNFSQFNPSGGPSAYDTQYTPVPYQVGGEEQVFEGKPYAMLPSDDGSFNYGANNQANFETANNIYNPPTDNNIIRNPNEETQPYRGIYVDPRTVPEINDVQSNTTYPPTMPADYDTGSNMNLVTITDEEYEEDVPIVFDSSPLNGPVGTSKYNTDNWINPDDYLTFNFDTNNNNNYVPKEKTGIDEVIKYLYAGGKEFVSNLFDDPSENTPLEGPAGSTAPSYTGSIDTGESQLGKINAALSGTSPGWNDYRIWENPPEPTPYSSGIDANLLNSFNNEGGDAEGQELYSGYTQDAADLASQYPNLDPSLINESTGSPLFDSEIEIAMKNLQSMVAPVEEHPGITAKKNLAWKAEQKAAAQQAYAQAQAALQAEAAAKAQGNIHAQAAAYSPPVNVPSIFKPQPAPVASVYAAPGGPPNRPTANPVSRPVYTWKPDYAAGRW